MASNHAKGTFKLAGWEENTIEEFDGGAKLTRAQIKQDFTGDLEGHGAWESLMCYRPDGRAMFTGLERVVGKIGDRSGSFVLRTEGVYDGKEAKTEWSVVPDSGTEGRAGRKGKGSSVAPHGPNGEFTLDYEL